MYQIKSTCPQLAEMECLCADMDAVVLSVKKYLGSVASRLMLRYEAGNGGRSTIAFECMGYGVVVYELEEFPMQKEDGRKTGTGDFSLNLGVEKELIRDAYYVIGYYDANGVFRNETYYILSCLRAAYGDHIGISSKEVAAIVLSGYSVLDRYLNPCPHASKDIAAGIADFNLALSTQMTVLETGVYMTSDRKYCIRPVAVSVDPDDEYGFVAEEIEDDAIYCEDTPFYYDEMIEKLHEILDAEKDSERRKAENDD